MLSSGVDVYRKPLSQAATVYLILLGAYHILAFVCRNNFENHFEQVLHQEQQRQHAILSPLERTELLSDLQCWKNIMGFTDFVFAICATVGIWRTIGYQTQQLSCATTGTSTTTATEIHSAAILLQRYQLFLALIVVSLILLILRQGLQQQSHPALEEANYAVLVFGTAFLWWPTATMLKGYHGIMGDDPEVHHHVELETVAASVEDSKGGCSTSDGEKDRSMFHEHAR